MKIHAVQLDSVWESPATNAEKVRQLLQSADIPAGGLIVLPEMFLTGFSMNTAATAQAPGGPQEQFLTELAGQYQCAVLGGVVTQPDDGGKPRNQAVAFAPDGTLLTRYTKRYPFTLGGEAAVHAAGDTTAVFDWNGLRIGPLVCYDLRFPEVAREAAALGAELLVCIASWPIARVDHWLTLLRARAIENQAWVAGVNRCGRDPNSNHPGRSIIVDPQGVIVADAGDREQVLSTTCDPQVARSWRQNFPALRDAGF